MALMSFPEAIPRRAYLLMIFDALVEFRRKLVKVILPVVAMLGISSALLNNPTIIYSIAAVVCLVSSVVYIRNYDRTVGDHEIRIKRGVGNLLIETVDVSKIERIEVDQTFVSRIIKLSTAHIFTSGSESPAITLHYLTAPQLDYIESKWGSSLDSIVFNHYSSLTDTMKAIFLPSFIRLFPQTLILMTLMIALVSSGDFSSQFTARTEMLSTLSNQQKLGEGGRQDELLATVTSLKTLSISLFLFYITSIFARFVFLLPSMSNFSLTVTHKDLIIKKGVFVQKTTCIPRSRIVKLRYSDGLYSRFMNGHQVTIDTISSSDSLVSIPFISHQVLNKICTILEFPNIDRVSDKLHRSSLFSSVIYGILSTKYTTPFAVLFGSLSLMTSNPAHFNLLIIVTLMFCLPLIASVLCANNAAVIKTGYGFMSMRETSIQSIVALFPNAAIGLRHESDTNLYIAKYSLLKVIVGGNATLLPSFRRVEPKKDSI